MKIVIVGAGEVGKHLAESLSVQRHDIRLLDASEGLVEELNEKLDAVVLCRNGAAATALAEANVAECDLFLALTSDSATNLVSASLAKAMGAAKTIARVRGDVLREEWLFDYKRHFNIDYLFGSERLAAVELAKYIRHPEGLFVEEIARGRIEIQQCPVSPESSLIGRTLEEVKLPQRVRIAYILRRGRHFIPGAQTALQASDVATLFGEARLVNEVAARLDPNLDREKEANVVIYGGKEYGFALAQMLEGGRCRVRVIEEDPRVCKDISHLLQKTVVLQGDATAQQLLREERVEKADFFVATTADDEDNVMACLQAKNLGAAYCLALIHRADYAEIILENADKLGILGAISPRMAISRDLLRFVTAEGYNSVMRLPGRGEVLEATVDEGDPLSGKKICDVRWPEGCGLVALLKGELALVPTGEDVIEPGDTVYGIVLPESKKDFIKLLG